jgi:hypothetical protein
MSAAMYSKVSEDGKNVVLSNGTNHPIIGFGTYKVIDPPLCF